jgi:hypothetical protein
METNITTVYASARRAGEVIGCSHKPIMARIGKNSRDQVDILLKKIWTMIKFLNSL